jgi:prepilin signal peptidase PulO-like enzyme (type II secretory pathway)
LLDILCNLLGAAFLLPLGTALGSFFEVVLDRLPRGESLLWPPSHCRTCKHRLPIREALSGLALGLPWAVVGCAHPVVAIGAGIVALLAIWIVRAVTQGRMTSV